MKKVMSCGLLVVSCGLSCIAATYGTLNAETNLVKAPPTVIVDGCYRGTDTITEPQANALGFKLVEDFPPACASNEYAVATGWEEREVAGCGLRVVSSNSQLTTDNSQLTTRIYRVYEKRVIVPPPRKFSKLKIYGAIIGLPDANGASAWERVKAWLEAKEIGGVNGWTAFQLAQEISEDHPLFTPLAEEARQLLGLTPTQFDALLNACILEQ